jgi:hypothetical protein
MTRHPLAKHIDEAMRDHVEKYEGLIVEPARLKQSIIAAVSRWIAEEAAAYEAEDMHDQASVVADLLNLLTEKTED